MHVRCPHCHSPIELVDEAPLKEIECPSCGSSFSLIDNQSTATYHRNEPHVLGHFQLIDHLGMGQFGSVWKAKDTELDRVVAVKIPRRDQIDADETELFFREARAAAQLRHPHIVSVHEVGRDNGTVYIVSDYVEGASLKEWLTGKRLSVREAAGLCVKLAEALHHAHQRGVIHRDLKPGNIMLDRSGEPHVMDFGLARREAGEITMTLDGQILGTPAYMPPEQARGEGHTVDRRADVYSIRVILFELLTGELPFRGEKRMLIVQILQDDPPSPRKLNTSVPRDLETICLKCLEKEPARRFATAQELADDLRRFLNCEPITARPVSRLERGWRWLLRHRNLAEQARVEAVQARDAEARAKDELDRLLYIRRVNLALATWNENEALRARQLLDECPRERRGWEWHYVYRLCHPELRTLGGHTDSVFSVAFSPDGQRIASGSHDGTVKLWDAATGRELRTLELKKHTGSVLSGPLSALSPDLKRIFRQFLNGAFSPDGQRIASGSFDGTVNLWDAATGQELLSLKGHSISVSNVAFSPDGQQIASGSVDGVVKLWNAATGQELRTFEAHTDSTNS